MKKQILECVAVAAAVGLMSACGSGAAETTAAQTQGQAQTAGTKEDQAETAGEETEAQETGEDMADSGEEKEPVTILAAAAASLKYSYDEELIPIFEDKYPWITVEGTYDSSGKLQTQIEEGLEADVFMSAAMQQMEDLEAGGYVDPADEVRLLENKIVLIVPAGSESGLSSFEDIEKAETIALGDPESVPAGQYAKEALTSLELWDAVSARASFGTNVTEVLNWVAEGSADAGIVYATDAATADQVTVVAEAPEGSLEGPGIYPVAVVKDSANREAAERFVEFLQSEEAMAVFEAYGFSPV